MINIQSSMNNGPMNPKEKCPKKVFQYPCKEVSTSGFDHFDQLQIRCRSKSKGKEAEAVPSAPPPPVPERVLECFRMGVKSDWSGLVVDRSY